MTTTKDLTTGTWTIDPAATTITVTVKKMMAFTVPAALAVTSGSIEVSDGRVTKVDVVADAASYTSRNTKRNEHVVSADFLDAANHPTISFSAASSSDVDLVSGEVTIKGRSTPITFNVSDLDVDGDSASFTASTIVDRLQLGVDKMPAFVIAKNLDIRVTASANREQ